MTVTVLAALMMAACGGGKKPDTAANKTSTDSADKKEDGDSKSDAGAASADGKDAPPKKDICTGFDISNLEDLLVKSDCEVPNTKPDALQNPDMKGKLEVALTASPTKVAPGGKVDLQVTFANKTKEPMTLHFRIDPVARFETEAYDAKGKKRVDMRGGTPRNAPTGHSGPPPAEQKVAKITLAANGSARVRVPWEAVKMKWAPEKVRGTAVEKGFPRKPNGSLAKGKYNVKVVTPLVGVFEGGEHEVTSPKVEIEVN